MIDLAKFDLEVWRGGGKNGKELRLQLRTIPPSGLFVAWFCIFERKERGKDSVLDMVVEYPKRTDLTPEQIQAAIIWVDEHIAAFSLPTQREAA